MELSHELDYLSWIFGEICWVQALMAKQSDLEINVEDTVHLIMQFSTENYSKPPIATVSLDFIRQDSVRYCTVIGKLGSLRWNGISGTVELFTEKSQSWLTVFKSEEIGDSSYIAEWNNIIECVEKKNSPLVKGEDGLKVMYLIDIIRTAAETGKRINLNQSGIQASDNF